MAKKKSKAKKKIDDANHAHKSKLSRKEYEAKLFKLHAELVKLQHWVKEKGHKIVVIFEGRDAAGKGGVIKRITERVSPRVFRVEALPTPTDGRKPRCTGSVISGVFLRPGRSCCLTAAGTTVPVSSAS